MLCTRSWIRDTTSKLFFLSGFVGSMWGGIRFCVSCSWVKFGYVQGDKEMLKRIDLQGPVFLPNPTPPPKKNAPHILRWGHKTFHLALKCTNTPAVAAPYHEGHKERVKRVQGQCQVHGQGQVHCQGQVPVTMNKICIPLFVTAHLARQVYVQRSLPLLTRFWIRRKNHPLMQRAVHWNKLQCSAPTACPAHAGWWVT